MEKENLVKDDSYIAFNPECIRKKANWSKSDKHYKFDTRNFNPAEVSNADPIIAQLNTDLTSYDERISQIEAGMKSELDEHKARIKRIKTMLRTGDLNELERNVLKLTMADGYQDVQNYQKGIEKDFDRGH